MNSQRVNITLPYNLIKQLHQSVPHGERSKFIAKAVEEKLQKKKSMLKELRKSLRASREYYKKEYKIWKVTETEAWPE